MMHNIQDEFLFTNTHIYHIQEVWNDTSALRHCIPHYSLSVWGVDWITLWSKKIKMKVNKIQKTCL
jgi:hypothetical protein